LNYLADYRVSKRLAIEVIVNTFIALIVQRSKTPNYIKFMT